MCFADTTASISFQFLFVVVVVAAAAALSTVCLFVSGASVDLEAAARLLANPTTSFLSYASAEGVPGALRVLTLNRSVYVLKALLPFHIWKRIYASSFVRSGVAHTFHSGIAWGCVANAHVAMHMHVFVVDHIITHTERRQKWLCVVCCVLCVLESNFLSSLWVLLRNQTECK